MQDPTEALENGSPKQLFENHSTIYLGGADSSAVARGYLTEGNAVNAAYSPWTDLPLLSYEADTKSTNVLVGSLVREEGHVYSLAATGDLLFAGSESKNICVWKCLREFTGFKYSSGLVKAIVVAGDRIFTGHQDGKIRVWKTLSKDSSVYKQVATVPRLTDLLRSSLNPSSYVQVRRHRITVWLRHFDAVSCLHLEKETGILYSGSWDKTLKVWRISDFKCLESIKVHDDAVNAVAAGFGDFVFTGSADGTVKVWRRDVVAGGVTRHVKVQTLLHQESAVTAVTAVTLAPDAGVIYCGSSDASVNFWGWVEGRKSSYEGVLRGHKMAVLCLAAAGRVVVSGSADKTLCVWRREKAAEGQGGAHTKLATLVGHKGPIKFLALEEDSYNEEAKRSCGSTSGQGYLVYSESLDRSVKIWRISESKIMGADAGRRKPEEEVNNAREGLLQSMRHVPGRLPGSGTLTMLLARAAA